MRSNILKRFHSRSIIFQLVGLDNADLEHRLCRVLAIREIFQNIIIAVHRLRPHPVLCGSIGGVEHLILVFFHAGDKRQHPAHKHVQSDTHHFSCSSTSSTCPFTFTFSNICLIFPFSSIMNVVRTTPMYLRPYMLFCCHTPYAFTISFDSSLTSVKGSSYFSLNPAWDFTLSGLTPSTTAPVFFTRAKLSRKSH